MRFISKDGRRSGELEDWLASQPCDRETVFADLQNPVKRNLHMQLAAEQGMLCCYCGIRICLDSSHIEHFRPQDPYREYIFSYENLFASCGRNRRPTDPLTCGHAKSSDFDNELAIFPTDEGCESHFKFALNGAVEPAVAEDKCASYMIGLLDLDGAALRDRRKRILDAVFDANFIETASADELANIADGCVEFDEKGQLLEFGHVIRAVALSL